MCGALLSAIALTIEEDERAVQEHVKSRLMVASSPGGASFSPLPQFDEEASADSTVNPMMRVDPYQDEHLGDERKDYRP